MLTFLHQLIIMPLELMIEVIRTVINRMVHHSVLAIIGGSIVVSFCILLVLIRWYFLREDQSAAERAGTSASAASPAKSCSGRIIPAAGRQAASPAAAGRQGILSPASGPAGSGSARSINPEHIHFILGGVMLTLLAGVLIPMSVISNSPSEFFRAEAYVTPMRFVASTVPVAAGIFLLYPGILYLIISRKTKSLLPPLYWVVSVCSLVNYMFFSRNFGDLSADLVFEKSVVFDWKLMALNMLAMIVLTVALGWVWRRKRHLVKSLYGILILAIVALSVTSILEMNRVISKTPDLIPASQASDTASGAGTDGAQASGAGTGSTQASEAASIPKEGEPVFHLSRTGKNVIVLMMDRMISSYLPFILNEKPELKEKLAGFTWYPNTLSFGVCTNYGSPALFGGYEYTPAKMNERSDELLKDKQNELLKVMPVLFSENGYEVTVCDPPYAGYQSVPDLSIYDDYPGIKAYNITHTGMYSSEMQEAFGDYFEEKQKRNFFFYSFFRMVPTVLQRLVYDNGRYLSLTTAANVNQKFIREYSALSHLSDMTGITDEAQGTFLMMANKTTHEETMLQMPDYKPALSVDNTPYLDPSLWTVDGVTMSMKTARQQKHYCVNMAAFLRLGEWFDYMRKAGVYDNTRIIIVADHGALHMKQFKNLKLKVTNVTPFNPMLLVKDFGAKEFTTDHSFMTNGDTPSLAMQDVIQDPVNPFTGKEINMDAKNEGPQLVTTSHNWKISKNHGTVFDTSDGKWLSVQDDIFVAENWKKEKTDSR